MTEVFLTNLENNSVELIEKYITIITLRDKLCAKSRGFIPNEKEYFSISKNSHDFIVTKCIVNYFDVPFKTEDDAQLICDILNIIYLKSIK